MDSLEQLVASAVQDFDAVKDDAAALENAKAKYLGKTGQITELMKGLGKLDPEARKAQGALINAAKGQIEAALPARRAGRRPDANPLERRGDRRLAARPRPRRRRHPPGDAHLGAGRGDLPLD